MTASPSRLALVFPGQGCQFVGMGKDICAAFGPARAMFQHADDVLGFALSKLCWEGPEAELNDTANTQPAIYVTTCALWKVLEDSLAAYRPRIAFAAGHSLGEYSALAVVGALDFADGLRLVRRRGEAMRAAGAAAPGAMAAILGLEDAAVAELVAEANAGGTGVWIANYNAPGQVVIAGEKAALERAMTLAKARGAKRALPLAVSVAAHTPLMEAASKPLRGALEDTAFQRPWAPVVSNADAVPAQEPSALRGALLRQLASPVRWVESIQTIVAGGATTMVEVGPKSVVAGMIKRIAPEAVVHAVADLTSLQALNLEGV